MRAASVAGLDIRPQRCPKRLSIQAGLQDTLDVAIIGSPDLEVWRLNLTSLQLSRADGIGGTLAPVKRRWRPSVRFLDIGGAEEIPACQCGDTSRDGIDDRVLTFSTQDVLRTLRLSTLPPGTSVELVLRADLADGSALTGSDCVVIEGDKAESP